MAISSLDLKFRQSERMTDFSDGGGRMSAVEVLDGVTNNVFSDLSDADGIIGNVSLRKVFMQVATANTDTFLKPFAYLTDLPQNANVSVLLFDTQSPIDERDAARSRYESYRTKATKTQYTLYGTHGSGQRTLMVYCRAETPSPDVGDVWCLSVERVGFTPAEQFVKIEKVESRVTTTFTDTQGDFSRDVLIVKITAALTGTFVGKEDPDRLTGLNPPPTLVRFTQVSDAARYFGMKACTVAPQAGDTVIRVGTPYVPAVPATQSEEPVVDQLAGLGSRSYVACSAPGAIKFSGAMSGAANEPVVRYLGTPVCPGSLTLAIGGVTLRDDGHGGLEAVDPINTGWGGTADYDTGAFAIARDVGFSGTVTATATGAGIVVQQAYTRALPIKAANRNISHVFQLPGQPSPGSVVIDYRALGKWIRLTDTGRGRIEGNPGEGSATINYASGSIAATLGALPDVDTAILVAWGTDLRARNSSAEITAPAPTLRQVLDHAGIVPGSLTMSWISGGAAKAASAAVDGAISGDASGNLDATSGIAEFSMAALPDAGEQIHYAYSFADPAKHHTEVFTPSPAGHGVSITLAHPAQPNSVVASWSIYAPAFSGGASFVRPYTVVDDGVGGFRNALGVSDAINYSTGAIALSVDY